jgi:hypothetical protein
MKKIIAITGLFLMATTSAFAAGSGNPLVGATAEAGYVLKATTPAASLIGKLSKGVTFSATYSNLGYAIETYHMSGTKAFGTAYDATAIYVNEVGAAATLAAPTSSVAAEAFPSPWAKM